VSFAAFSTNIEALRKAVISTAIHPCHFRQAKRFDVDPRLSGVSCWWPEVIPASGMARGPTYPVAPEKIIVAAKSLFTCFRITTAHSPTRKRAIHAACLWVRPGFGVATHAPVQFCTPALFLVGPGHSRGPGYGRFLGGSWAYHSPQWPVRIREFRPTQANSSSPFGRVFDNSPTSSGP